MLAPHENLEGVRIADAFAGMIGDLPWPNFRAYVLANSQLSKLCQLGGYRLEPKHRKRFELLLQKEAEKNQFSASFCNPIFAQWYPVHETLYRAIEDYFHGDEYKQYRQAQSLAEDAYVLPQEKFDALFKVADLAKWRILLCFSPMQFSKEQAEKVVQNAGGNEELLSRVKEMEERLDAARAESARLEGELERTRSQSSGAGDELQELRKAKRDLTAERGELQTKFESSQSENRKLRQSIAQSEEEQKAALSRAAAETLQEKGRLAASLDKLEKEVQDWRSRYEQQRAEDRELKDRIGQAENDLNQERARLQTRDRAVQELQNYADLVLRRIDWVQAGKNLRLTPELQKQFNSVMKKLHYESGTPSFDATLPAFWNSLLESERELIEHVAQSNTLEVAGGNAEAYWTNLKEPFEDVIIGVEARMMLLKLLREIFYQAIEIEDLEAPKLPPGLLKLK